MTKPATMRWKVVPSKKPLPARYLNDPPVFGARLLSSVIWKSPQLVLTVATKVFPAASSVLGLASLTDFGAGLSTFSQPVAVCDPEGVALAAAFPLSSDFEPPQADRTSAQMSAARRPKGSRSMGGDDNGDLAALSRAPALRPRAARPRRLPVGRR